MSSTIVAAGQNQSRALNARLLVSTAVIAALAGALPAHADNTAAAPVLVAQQNPGPTPADASAQKSSKEDTTLEEVVVTGSRIVRRDYESQSPIVTINADAFKNNSSVALESTLNQLPQFNPSGNQSSLSPAQNPFPSATSTPGAATLDLRGLGPNRTLVLVDGQRAQPINATLAVDLNTIPSAAIESVEAITGGAASTYGADAIAGVVNFKLKKNFQGLQFDAQTGISQQGDDQENQVSALMGTNFGDGKGNIMMALSYAKRGGVQGADHAWVRAGWNDPGTLAPAPGGTNLSEFVWDTANVPSAGGWIGKSPAYYIDQNGSLFDANSPTNSAHPYTGPVGGTSGYKVNRDGTLGFNNEQNDQLQIPLTRWSAFASGHFNINDHVSVYAKLNYSETKTSYEGGTDQLENIWAVTVPYNPLYDDPSSATFQNGPPGTKYHPVPQQLATLLDSRTNPGAPWTYNGGLDYIGGFTELNTSDVYQFTLGFNGDVPFSSSTKDWTWDVYGSHGQTNVIQQQPNGYPSLSQIQALFNSNMYGQGFTNSFPIAVGGGCTSGLPIFNANGSVNNSPTISANCTDWILLRMNTITQLTQQIAEADLQGGLFEMPFSAGKVRFALGADYRSDDFNFNPDSGYNANQPYPNVVNNIALPVGVAGSTSVSEVYTEFSIPLVKDLPFVKSLEFDPGFRYSRYNTTGGVNTFKLLGDWAVTDWIKFRGGLEVANRAPNIAELFTPIGGSSLTFGYDPCAVYPQTPSWGNSATNPNRLNAQALCQYLITRDGGPASIMVPGASANNYQYFFGGYTPNAFPFPIALTQGNPDLKSEVARTLTVGTVIRAPFTSPLLSKMTLSLDAYHVQLDGAIGIPAFNTVYQECLSPQYNTLVGAAPGTYSGAQMAANNPYCGLINREYAPQAGDVYGAMRNYKAEYINQGGIKTAGLDAQFDWNVRPSDVDFLRAIPGSLGLNVVGSYLQEYQVSPFTGASYINYTGTVGTGTSGSLFRYKLLSTLTYSVGPATGGLRWQHLPSVAAAPGSSPGTLGAGSYNLYSLFGSWTINDTLEIRGGVDNLFNVWPEWAGAIVGTNNNTGTTNENYDTIGRRFYLGLRARF